MSFQRAKATPTIITSLKKNEIFVFGSNLAGIHGGGAALQARTHFGAIQGRGEGRMGSSYGIPTKNEYVERLPLWRISRHVRVFLRYALTNYDLKFLVTPIGCGMAGYAPKQIAHMFLQMEDGLPDNVYLPAEFLPFVEV